MTNFEFNRDEMKELISELYGRYPTDDAVVKLYDIIMENRVQVDAEEVLLIDERMVYG